MALEYIIRVTVSVAQITRNRLPSLLHILSMRCHGEMYVSNEANAISDRI